MTQMTVRGNLREDTVPFLTELFGNTVILPGLPEQKVPQESPQIYYAHNVMPSKNGVTSVGYFQLNSPPLDTQNLFNEIFTIRDSNENSGYFCHTSSGRNYVWLSTGGGWIRTNDSSEPVNGLVTTAHVNGQTYINLSLIGTFRYDFASNLLIPITLSGTDPAQILGVAASNGYMIAWTKTNLLWSSTIDPTDFVPSLVTGAGGEGVQNTKAAITVCLPHSAGVMIYTKKNAVSAAYSGNTNFPWIYTEVSGAGGLSTPALVASDGNSTDHFAYTTSGLQQITVNASSVIAPELTDFIAGAEFEDYDEITGTFTRIQLSSPMAKKLTMVGNRYLVFSYGVTQLTHCLVYDLALNRWGKLKLNHVDCFEYYAPVSEAVENPKRSIGLLQADGTVYSVVLSYQNSNSYGVLLLGKYQMDRNHYLGIQEIHLSSVQAGSTLNVKVTTTVDGLNSIKTTIPTLAVSNGNLRRYNLRSTGLNHSIAIAGSFQLNTILLKFSDEGETR